MGMYTYWRFRAYILPQYVSQIEYFREHDEWLEPVPEFITQWREFLKSIGRSYNVYENDDDNMIGTEYHYIGATGCNDGYCYFGCDWSFENNIWNVSAGIKNYNQELEVFFTKVLVPMSSYIEECSIITDYYLDYKEYNKYRFPDDPKEKDPIRNYTDKELRTTNWNKLSFF